jgi:acetoin utilization deacetylase AcuC-like enzyme
MPLKTGYLFNGSFLHHELEPGHPESAERLVAIDRQISSCPDAKMLYERLPSVFDPGTHLPLIALVHTGDHIDDVCSIPDTGRAACDAVAAVVRAVDAVFNGEVANAFCAVRPPGHHVHNNPHRDGINQGEGFCFFNNIAIAARYAQHKHDAKHILIVDWDFHHGNGTEEFFYDDPSVFYFSTHRYGNYPGSGLPLRTGCGAGTGYTFNYPLPRPGDPFSRVTDEDLIAAFTQLCQKLDALAFLPDLILISAGFDGLKSDPLGNFELSEEVFYRVTRLVMDIAQRSAGGRIVSILEGGYHPASLAAAVEQHMRALAGAPASAHSSNSDRHR